MVPTGRTGRGPPFFVDVDGRSGALLLRPRRSRGSSSDAVQDSGEVTDAASVEPKRGSFSRSADPASDARSASDGERRRIRVTTWTDRHHARRRHHWSTRDLHQQEVEMLFVFFCTDKAGRLAVRQENRTAHLAYLDQYGDKLFLAGPTLADDGTTMNGSLIVMDLADLAEAKAFAAGDPYAKAGLFERSRSDRGGRRGLRRENEPGVTTAPCGCSGCGGRRCRGRTWSSPPGAGRRRSRRTPPGHGRGLRRRRGS